MSFPHEVTLNIASLNMHQDFEILFRYRKSYNSYKFIDIDNELFTQNLILVESALPSILAKLLLSSISHQNFNFDACVGYLTEVNPLKLDLRSSHYFYQHKLLELLKHLASGMNHTQVWSGRESLSPLQFKKSQNQIITNSNLIKLTSRSSSPLHPESLEIRLTIHFIQYNLID